MNAVDQMLVLRDNAKAQLMQIQSVEDGISYLNKLSAIDKWVKAEKKDAELQNIVAEQKLRTQRILGELLREGQRKGLIASKGDRVSNVPDENISTLNDVGLSRKQSSTFQQIASIPEEKFEDFIAEKKEAVSNAVAELTTTGALRLAKSLNSDVTSKSKIYEHSESDYEHEVKELVARINKLPIIYRIKVKQGIKRGK